MDATVHSRGESTGGRARTFRASRAAPLRVPIAVKFTVFLALLMVAFLLWLMMTAIRVAQSELEAEVNGNGVVLSTAVSGLLDPELIIGFEQDELVARLSAFADSPGPTQARVLNIVVYDDEEKAIATAGDEDQFVLTSHSEPVTYAPATAAGVSIRELAINNSLARSFSRAIRDESGEPVGRIELYLSAAEIESSRLALRSAMITVASTALLLAVVSSFILASLLTRPIRSLRRDMRVVSGGDLEHKSSVRSWDELGDLARTFNAMTASLHTAQEAKLEQQALEHELSTATEIQQRLLPRSTPELEGFDVASHYASAREVGGDYYDFVSVDDAHVGVVVADVSGKSVPGSLVMTMTRSLLRLAAAGEPSPARTVQLVNRFLSPDVTPGMFVTLAYLVLDKRTADVRLVRCGHNAPLLFSTAQRRLIRLQPGGLALCLDRDGRLFQSELQVQRFALRTGDLLILYTDGVTEAKDAAGSDYGDERLAAVVGKHAGSDARTLLEAIVADVSAHRGSAPQSDDITLVVLKRIA